MPWWVLWERFGQEMLKILAQRNFPVGQILALDIPENAGKTTLYNGKPVTVQATEVDIFKDVDMALFAVGDSVSKTLAPEVAKQGCIVIDNSSAWRMDPNVPLVVPEVNSEDLKKHKGIIANPNCSTIIAMVPIKPLHDYAGLKRIVASTYQAVSGAGRRRPHGAGTADPGHTGWQAGESQGIRVPDRPLTSFHILTILRKMDTRTKR